MINANQSTTIFPNSNKLNSLFYVFDTKRFIFKILILCLATTILFYRKPYCFIHPQFWAEDGLIFFQQSILYGVKSFIIPYNGYLHFIPRTIAFFSSFFPYAIIPALYNYSAFAVFLVVSAHCFSSRLPIRYKGLLALSIAIVPNTSEVYMTITNIQWFTAAMIPLLLFKDPPKTIWQTISDYLIVLVVGLTGPFIIFALPLFLLKFLLQKSKHNLIIFFLSTIVTAIQIYFIYTTLSLGHHFQLSTLLIKTINYRFFGLMFLGTHAINFSPLFLCLITVLLIIMLCWFASANKIKWFYLSTCGYFGIMLLFAAFQKAGPSQLFGTPLAGDRYFFLPHLMLLWGLIICLDTNNLFKKTIVTILLGAVLYSSYTQIKLFTPYLNYHWKDYAKELDSDHAIKIPINPSGWFIDLSLGKIMQKN